MACLSTYETAVFNHILARHWGQFYDGDCYLLLDKNQEEEHVGTNTWNMLLNPLFLVA